MRVRVLSQFMFTQLLNLHTEAETLDPETLSIWLRASRFPVVEPDVVHTKLAVAKKGLEVISRITNPVAVVAVIGPYRSGKSFLLNQLLTLSCNEGFGVGHMRDTKTRGIWVWGEPLEMEIDGQTTSVLFLDTEGFESIGKSTVYDDRIFALAAIMSSVLIYNLPETVREADIGKLSFAVQLAEEFYGRYVPQISLPNYDPLSEAVMPLLLSAAKITDLTSFLALCASMDIAIESVNFIQCAEGKSVQQMVDQALQPVPNVGGNREIDEVNRIRESLAMMAENSTAFSLRQPHLARTKLCDLNDTDFDSEYVVQRNRLKSVIASMISPKKVQGKLINGKEFAALLEQVLDALNQGEIPSAGSVVDSFNRGVMDRCLLIYETFMNKVKLPLPDVHLDDFHTGATDMALSAFEKDRFGRFHGDKAEVALKAELEKTYASLVLKNQYLSSQQCEDIYNQCEESMDSLQTLRLPSMAKFEAGVAACNRSYEVSCLGPSKKLFKQRLDKMWSRSRTQFLNDYNHRLFNWIVGFSLVMVVVARFCFKFYPLEIAAWALFVMLEAYTHLFWSAESLYYNPTWQVVVGVWETLVYNPVIDLDRWAVPLAWFAAASFVYCRYQRRRKHPPIPLLPSQDGPRPSSSHVEEPKISHSIQNCQMKAADIAHRPAGLQVQKRDDYASETVANAREAAGLEGSREAAATENGQPTGAIVRKRSRRNAGTTERGSRCRSLHPSNDRQRDRDRDRDRGRERETKRSLLEGRGGGFGTRRRFVDEAAAAAAGLRAVTRACDGILRDHFVRRQRIVNKKSLEFVQKEVGKSRKRKMSRRVDAHVQEFRGDTDKLLECPCLDGMKQGPCGPDFLEAFKCFILSKEPEKGADCEANFTTLETCLMANNDALKDAPAGRQKGANIPKIPPKAIKLPPTIGTWPPPE
ncbi:hypothetical protein AXG93_2396s1140 [Marchantia polymorpha subsp. ruderalis]|uniref:GB1/RHD3-type G domain-containing protein n=1 Tax=Marchantia polymorpha subsp. ruderalis TaxID=1480154 RepID=A0A176VE05_MARPO|nr:hypothetical protein AXG93_2396s1140 [Marchantia polymorpha subsp. ruderalis]